MRTRVVMFVLQHVYFVLELLNRTPNGVISSVSVKYFSMGLSG